MIATRVCSPARFGEALARVARGALLAVGAFAAVGGAVAGSSTAMLTGQVALADHATSPPLAVLEVALVDLSALDEDDHLLGSVRMDAPGTYPARYAVPYDPRRLVRGHQYVLRAVLRVGGQPVQSGEWPLPAGRRIREVPLLTLRSLEAPADVVASPPLVGTEWRMVAIDGQPVVAPGPSSPWLVLAENQRAAGQSGCNRFAGRYELADAQLHFDGLALTRMACVSPELNALETKVTAALGAITGWHLSGAELELKDASGTVRIRLEPRRSH